MIKLTNVSFKYDNGVHALNNINLEINDGEFVYITGTTGSGKSTLIKLLDTEIVPTKGTVMVNDINVGKLRRGKVPLYRRTIGVVFQDFRLLPKKTVFENIAFALEVVDTPKDKLRKRVREVLKLVGLREKYKSLPSQISGGQMQRTAIARAIANKPKVLIADEPTGNLDPKISEEIISLFEKINKEEGTTIIIVTHDAQVVRNHPKRTIKIDQGHIVSDKMNDTIDDIVKKQEHLDKTRELELFKEEKKEEEQQALMFEKEENV